MVRQRTQDFRTTKQVDIFIKGKKTRTMRKPFVFHREETEAFGSRVRKAGGCASVEEKRRGKGQQR
jgi:hypothetical protein